MKKIYKIFFCGTVIYFFTVPFSFSQIKSIYTPALPLNPSYSTGRPVSGRVALSIAKGFSAPELSDSLKIDSITSHKTELKKFRMKKSPWLAVLQSAVLPGLGQLYNESYWKIPVIFGLSAYLGYEVYDNNKKYLDYRDRYANSQSTINPGGDLNLQSLRNFYRDQRDEFIWYLTIVYVINLVDAYVDAHLFDFDVKEQKIESQGFYFTGLQLRMKIHF